MLVSAFFPEVARLASQPHSNGVVVQSVCHGQDLELRSDVDAISSSWKGSLVLVSELQGQILSSCQHLHANFVLPVCIELLEPHFDAVSVVIHARGCRVLHGLIEHGSCKPQLIHPVDSILGIVEKADVACALQPARSLGGTDVVSKLLSPNPNTPPLLVSALVREVACLASHPHGTRFVSELVCHCSGLKLRSDVDVLLSWLKGPFVLLNNDCLDCRAALREVASETQQRSVSESQGQLLSVCQHLRANVDRLAYRVPSSAALVVPSASEEPDVPELRFCRDSGSLGVSPPDRCDCKRRLPYVHAYTKPCKRPCHEEARQPDRHARSAKAAFRDWIAADCPAKRAGSQTQDPRPTKRHKPRHLVAVLQCWTPVFMNGQTAEFGIGVSVHVTQVPSSTQERATTDTRQQPATWSCISGPLRWLRDAVRMRLQQLNAFLQHEVGTKVLAYAEGLALGFRKEALLGKAHQGALQGARHRIDINAEL